MCPKGERSSGDIVLGRRSQGNGRARWIVWCWTWCRGVGYADAASLSNSKRESQGVCAAGQNYSSTVRSGRDGVDGPIGRGLGRESRRLPFLRKLVGCLGGM